MAEMTLQTAGTDLLEAARQQSSGRASRTIHSGKHLRQTLTALTMGTKMSEHQSPGDATLMCLRGQVTLHCRERSVTVEEGAIADIPPQRHDLVADQDSLILLTVALG